MRNLFTILLLLVSACTLYARTYYYERVTNNSSKDGHYISFGNNCCYDSDKEGMSSKNGVLPFICEDNGKLKYRGKGYFGNSIYLFSKDFNTLEIKVIESGNVYTYKRLLSPSGEMAKRGYSSPNKSSTSSSTSVGTVVVPTYVSTPTTSVYDGGTSTSTSTSTTTSSPRYGYKDCQHCWGSGKCQTCYGRGYTSSTYTGGWMDCPNCNHGECSICHGTGKVYGIIGH